MTSTQKMIFLSVGLLVSILVNTFLFFENNHRQQRVAALNEEMTTLESQNLQRQQTQRQRGEQVELMKSTQLELATMIQDLQTALTDLKADYQQSQEVAELTARQLSTTKKQAQQFQTDLAFTQRRLKDADATIANLKRALINSSKANTLSDPSQDQALTELIQHVQSIDPNNDIGIVQKSDQSISINIPLETLFEPGTVQLRSNAHLMLTPIAQSIKKFGNRPLQVIGHSDERPITSSLSINYPTNWELSAVRASKVLVNLIEQGIDKSRFTVAGKAANNPIRDESDATAWKINRRIEIVIE